MSSLDYDALLKTVRDLTPQQQRKLLEALTALVHRPPVSRQPRSVMELEGLGKQIWRGVDAQAYVNSERNSWDG